MARWTKYFKPTNSVMPVSSSQGKAGSPVRKFSSWLPEVYQGPPNRLQRYAQYEEMDRDHDVHAALDTIAEFATHPDEDTGLPFQFKFHEDPTEQELKILKNSLRQWCKLNTFPKRVFKMFRSALKYGDQFFIRDPETYKLVWIDPQTVERVVVNESKGKKPEIYYVRDLDLNLQTTTGTDLTKKSAQGGYGSADSMFPNAPLTGQANFAHGDATPAAGIGGTNTAFPVDALHMIHMSLTEGMDDAWPFGVSILEKVFKVYKQKELLEDAILIYRVHRAPERRVFYIDTGTMPPQRAQQYLERVRYEVQQKRIPSRTGGGQSVMDSAYNPLSSLEDYFFANSADGRGSKVEVLPGGANLGEIDDMRYWNNKMFRGLGIPSSYLPTGLEDGTQTFNDGRIGAAFIQEFRFTRYCRRLQKQLMDPLDKEFKLFLKRQDIQIESSGFELEFNEPQNFQEYRQIEIDSAHASVFGSLSEVPYIAKRFLLKRYLGWTAEDIIENEALIQQEQGTGPTDEVPGGSGSDPGIRNVGVSDAGFDDFGDIDNVVDDDGITDSDDLGDTGDGDVDSFGEE